MTELILGIDDAGRGPVIGPLVLAGCLINRKIEPELRKLGVRDSKQLTPKRREFLADKIREKAETFEVVLANADHIDKKMGEGVNLNLIEAIKAAEIINKINSLKTEGTKIKVVVDCPSVSILKWEDLLKARVENLSNLEISCEHKADKNHIAVSAASILAKSMREKEMTLLKEKYGDDMGSGYTSDPLTKSFLEKNGNNHKDKGLFRKTWKTWKKSVGKAEQKKLEF